MSYELNGFRKYDHLYKESPTLKQMTYNLNAGKGIYHYKYNRSFQINMENDIFLCNCGTLSPNISIKDVMIESKIWYHYQETKQCRKELEYLIMVPKKGKEIILAIHTIGDECCENDFTNLKQKFDDGYIYVKHICGISRLQIAYPIYNSLSFMEVINRKQMKKILDILSQKINDLHGHFHKANEQFIYSHIFHTLLKEYDKENLRLNTYLKQRKQAYPDINITVNKDSYRIMAYKNNIVEHTTNLMDVDDEITDVVIHMQEFYNIIPDSQDKKVYMNGFPYSVYDIEINTQHKQQALCKFYCDTSLENKSEKSNHQFWNHYFTNKFDVYLFHTLPFTAKQCNQIIDIIKSKYVYTLYTEQFTDILQFAFTNSRSIQDKELKQPLDACIKASEITQEKEKSKQLKIDKTEEKIVYHLNQMAYHLKESKRLFAEQQLQNSQTYHTPKVYIPDDQLFIEVDDHLEINPNYLPYLKHINLAATTFSNVKVSGIDFSDTNAPIDPQLVYQKDMSNGNYKGIDFTFKYFGNVDITNSKFDDGYGGYQYSESQFSKVKRK